MLLGSESGDPDSTEVMPGHITGLGQITKLPDINIRLSREGTQLSINFHQFHQLQLLLGEVRGGQGVGNMGYEKRPGRIQGN